MDEGTTEGELMPGECLVFDLESDGFEDTLTRIWTIQIGAVDTDEATVYADQPGFPPLSDGVARLKAARLCIGQNIFGFDYWVIERFYPGTLTLDRMFDTLPAARLLDPDRDSDRLEDWGRELGTLKGEYRGDFQTFDEELVTYARQDIPTTRALYNHVKKGLEGFGSSVGTTQKFAWLMTLQQRNGFRLDVKAAEKLDAEFRGELATEAAALRGVFPPIWVRADKSDFIPKRDDKRAGYVAGCPLTKVKLQEFNPGSRRQVAERLKRLGWKPKTFNKDGTPKIDDDILSSLPWPEAKRLVTYFTISKKLGQISDGKVAWLKLVGSDGIMHGRIKVPGCAPGRCSHSTPNMAQVNKKDLRMREVWGPTRPGWKLVGVDGAGIQARGLASYLSRYDGGAYTDKILNGNKADRTDEHSSNLKELPFLNAAFDAPKEQFAKARDGSKTCLYCVLFGGQDPKLGRTVKEACRDAELPRPMVPDRELGRLARMALFRAIKGFDKLYEAIQTKAIEQHWLRGIDGRHIPIRSLHSALVFLMQGFEAAVMQLAQVVFHFERCPELGLQYGSDFAYCAQVHDEVQIECRPEVAELVGKTFAECITEAGVRLGSRCPLEGDFSIGANWRDTH